MVNDTIRTPGLIKAVSDQKTAAAAAVTDFPPRPRFKDSPIPGLTDRWARRIEEAQLRLEWQKSYQRRHGKNIFYCLYIKTIQILTTKTSSNTELKKESKT